jgi:hypothetical protein
LELTNSQASRLSKLYRDLGELLLGLGIAGDGAVKPPPDPQWLRDTAKQWGLLNAVADLGGDVGSDRWSRLGRQHGYDPRGLGGFFQGAQPLMAAQGARRVLTHHGHRFIERWRDDFAPDAEA